MLYLIAEWFISEDSGNLIRYQSFRAGAALMCLLILGLLIGPRFINMLRVRRAKASRSVKTGRTHLAKRGTPRWAD